MHVISGDFGVFNISTLPTKTNTKKNKLKLILNVSKKGEKLK